MAVYPCAFDGKSCFKDGRCAIWCDICRAVHNPCSRFDVEKFEADSRRGLPHDF